MAYTSETFKAMHMKTPPYGFCINILFASTIILIFTGIILNILSRILILKIKLLRVPTVHFEQNNCRNSRENTKSIIPSWKEGKKPPKIHTEN